MNHEHLKKLYLELASFENRGITIWMDGSISDSKQVSNQICVGENNTYMRDYIFDEGVLKEIHFDKVEKDTH